MNEIVKLFGLADKKFRSEGIDTSVEKNRLLVYDVVLEAYSAGARFGSTGVNPLVDLGKEYVARGIEHLKDSHR